MLTSKIAPSLMCADFLHLQTMLEEMKTQGIEYLHIDVMDGSFVPNFTLGTDFCKTVKKASSIPLDLHLMICNPEMKLQWFPIAEGDFVSVHYESGYHVLRSLQTIREMGGKPMIALNPATPVCVLAHVLSYIDGVLVMTVNPGFAGQKMVEGSLEKIMQVRRFLDEHGRPDIEIEVDGNVSFENAGKMRAAGANIFVAGTSSLLSGKAPLKELTAKFRESIQ